MNADTAIKTIADFALNLMEGEPVPPTGSKELEALAEAIKVMHAASSVDTRMLGLRVLGLVIDRVRSAVGAEQTLRNFLLRREGY